MELRDLLNEIFHRTEKGDFVTMDELETEFGLSGSDLRPMLEDLKEARVVVEHHEGFQVTPHGITECRSRWA